MAVGTRQVLIVDGYLVYQGWILQRVVLQCSCLTSVTVFLRSYQTLLFIYEMPVREFVYMNNYIHIVQQ